MILRSQEKNRELASLIIKRFHGIIYTIRIKVRILIHA